MPRFWHRKPREDQPEPTASAPEDRLTGTRPMHIDPDDDRPTREDVETDKKSKRPGGGFTGGPGLGV